ncbi:MAG: TonB-dependent receptor [Bacteroidetes bacterium]|nr:TonB-dependent receptor [Bacteroidota bacterium]
MKKLLFFVSLLLSLQSIGQGPPQGRGNWMNNPMMKSGHFYGKVVDSISGKPVEFASIQLWGNKLDSASRAMKPVLLDGMLSKQNGDFSFENLPLFGWYTLKISFVGFKLYEQKISFGLKMDDMGQGSQNPGAMLNKTDKDLGNLKLQSSINQLKEVTIDGTAPLMELKLDKKVFNVEKNITSTGGTAEDVLKNVPSVNVDMDGNVSLRNSSPQIFVDGKPTTLTIDQIPADAIESVELITNPSAKYDASGGHGGIINIVLKKQRKIGYNGGVRAGVDMRGKMNLGGDLNSRQGKINVFANVMLNQRKSIVAGETERFNLIGFPKTTILQNNKSISEGFFAFGRGGIDWFIDNRNTLTLSGGYTLGEFNSTDNLNTRTDSLFATETSSSNYKRNSNTSRNFNNVSGAVQYKHLFPKAGRELTADVNYNSNLNKSGGLFETQYYDANDMPLGNKTLQKQDGNGDNQFITIQSDYVNPIGDKKKIEAGLRASIKKFSNRIDNLFYNDSANEYQAIIGQSSNYKFSDQVYAAYITFAHQVKKFNYQAGLRLESSIYEGEQINTASKFQNQYPLSAFPSFAATYNINEKSDLQFNYTRKVNRPNFFQLIPFTDYSDSLNLSRGNPALKPEFTNSLELSYLKNFNRANNFLATVWYKNTSDLITRYQVNEYDTLLSKSVIINTYANANSSYAYGLELTSKNSIKKWLDISTNVNFYNSVIDGTNLQSGLSNEQFSYFGKMSLSFNLPKNFSVQVSGDYQSKTSVPVSSGGGGRGGGGGGGMNFGGGQGSTLQGYNKPNYGVDIAVKYEFMKNKVASLTLNCSDVFKTKKQQSYSESPYFIQTTSRTRDQQLFRLTFSYRFGKFDASLFKRKNTKINTDGIDMQGM